MHFVQAVSASININGRQQMMETGIIAFTEGDPLAVDFFANGYSGQWGVSYETLVRLQIPPSSWNGFFASLAPMRCCAEFEYGDAYFSADNPEAAEPEFESVRLAFHIDGINTPEPWSLAIFAPFPAIGCGFPQRRKSA